MKKLLCLFLAFAMLVVLSACTDPQLDPDTDDKPKKNSEEAVTFYGLQFIPPKGYWMSEVSRNLVCLQNDQYEIWIEYNDPALEEYPGFSAEQLQKTFLEELENDPYSSDYLQYCTPGNKNGIYYIAVTEAPDVGNMVCGFFEKDGHSWIVRFACPDETVRTEKLVDQLCNWKCSVPKEDSTPLNRLVFKINYDSMAPALYIGDRILCEPVTDPSALQVGDIITYWTVIRGLRVLDTNRITAIYDGGGYLIFATKGDNRLPEEPLIVHESEVVGKFVKVLGQAEEDSSSEKPTSNPTEENGLLGNNMIVEIQTDSMLPTFAPGNRILCKKVTDPSTLQVGDIITYWTIIDGERVMNTHRITAIYNGGDFLIFETKGDNNPAPDPLNVLESEIIAKFIQILE